EHLQSGAFLGGVIFRIDLAQQYLRSVVHDDASGRSRVVVHRDVFEVGNKAHVRQRFVVVLNVAVRLGGTFVVIEGNAGRNDVEHGRAVMGQCALDERQQLALVAGEGASHIGGPQLNGQGAGIDGRQIVHDAGLELGAQVGGCR